VGSYEVRELKAIYAQGSRLKAQRGAFGCLRSASLEVGGELA
jgi:hypothetical protein